MKNHTLLLAPFVAADFNRLISWLDNEELLVQVAGPIFSFPLTVKQLEAYLEDENRHAFKVIDLMSDRVIGHAELYLNADGSAKICRVVIAEESFRGKGLGKELISLLVACAKDDLKAPVVELNVYDWNTQAINCYQKAGFIFNPEKVSYMEVKGNSWKSLNMVFGA